MAEDLTPPEPDRTPDVASSATAVETPPAIPLVDPPRRPAESRPFRYRFGLAYLVLAVLAGGGVGSAIILLDREPATEVAWSSWKPVGRESSFAAQVSDFVSGRYRHPDTGGPLVGVLASKPQIQTQETSVPIQAVAIQNDPEGDTDDISIMSTEEGSLMYTLCGLGERCAIREGVPTVERAQLLRREALELALYSFKYMGDLKSVIVLMPPNLGKPNDPSDDTSTALFFEKRDFRRELSRPLQRTLVSRQPARISAIERLTIDRLTEPRRFLYEFTQTPAGFAVIVLAPILR